MGLFDFIQNYKQNNNKVGVFVTTKSTIEVVEFDYDARRVLKYTSKEINYDVTSREIRDTTVFADALMDAFTELEISPNTVINVALPNIFMDFMDLPEELEDEAVRMALTSETERHYIFKKQEPVVSWQKQAGEAPEGMEPYVYAALQVNEIGKIQSAFDSIGYKVATVDSSYSSLLRGIAITGEVNHLIKEEENWDILLITNNSFVIFYMEGAKLVSIYEEPLAIKSFNGKDIYPTIASIAMPAISERTVNHVLVISEVDEVSSEIMMDYITTLCPKSFIELNKFVKEDLYKCDLNVLPQYIQRISPEAVGAACWHRTHINLSFDFKGGSVALLSEGVDVELFGINVLLTPQLLQNIIVGFDAILLIILTSIYLVTGGIISKNNDKVTSLNAELTGLQQMSTQTNTTGTITIADLVKNVFDNNKKMITSFGSTSQQIPEKVWIDSVQIENDLSSNIKGKAVAVDDIVAYYNSLIKFGGFIDFKILNLKVADPSMPQIIPDVAAQNAPPAVPGQPAQPAVVVPTFKEDVPLSKYYEFEFGKSITAAPAAGAPPMGAPPAGAPAPTGGM